VGQNAQADDVSNLLKAKNLLKNLKVRILGFLVFFLKNLKILS